MGDVNAVGVECSDSRRANEQQSKKVGEYIHIPPIPSHPIPAPRRENLDFEKPLRGRGNSRKETRTKRRRCPSGAKARRRSQRKSRRQEGEASQSSKQRVRNWKTCVYVASPPSEQIARSREPDSTATRTRRRRRRRQACPSHPVTVPLRAREHQEHLRDVRRHSKRRETMMDVDRSAPTTPPPIARARIQRRRLDETCVAAVKPGNQEKMQDDDDDERKEEKQGTPSHTHGDNDERLTPKEEQKRQTNGIWKEKRRKDE
ncbi:hypothetical protein R3P38DRAFT_243733 [Favolaschia claudopus]|uniref:Uncharacterized protein n=1 Tax=Favolaschia claudopus TaxID=2862362 RepID=A0AAW0CZV7_9AGAR